MVHECEVISDGEGVFPGNGIGTFVVHHEICSVSIDCLLTLLTLYRNFCSVSSLCIDFVDYSDIC